MLSKRTFPSDFVKLGSEILYLFLAEKLSFVVCFVLLQYFVRFVLKKIELLINLRKMLLRKQENVPVWGRA